VVGIDDIDGDGVRDFAYSTYQAPFDVAAVSGATSEPLWMKTLSTQFPPVFFPETSGLVLAGDYDGDGFRDLVVASENGGPNVHGVIAAVSGKTGAKLWNKFGFKSGDRLGSGLDTIQDLNGNGTQDILVGARLAGPTGGIDINQGAVYALEGSNGSLIYSVFGPGQAADFASDAFWYGATVATVGDHDGDGIDDFIMCGGKVTKGPNLNILPSYPRCHSGADGSLIQLLPLDPILFWEGIGSSVTSIPDQNNDAIPEIAVGYASATAGGLVAAGGVQIYRGGTLELLQFLPGKEPYELRGYTISCAGDLDGDQVEDLLVGSDAGVFALPGAPLGIVTAYSGATWTELFSIAQSESLAGYPYKFGAALAPLGDINADGVPEFLVGAQYSTGFQGGVWLGRVYIYSPVNLSLKVEPYLLPISLSNTQQLKLHFTAAHADELYLVLGSFRGNDVVLSLDGIPLPLHPDSYTLAGLSGASIAQPFAGQLNGEGRALVTATVPPLSPSQQLALLGKPLWHVALAIHPLGYVSAISNPAPLTPSP
jgi:hypothetical protein